MVVFRNGEREYYFWFLVVINAKGTFAILVDVSPYFWAGMLFS
jgi:hypothetical protein